MGRLPATGLRGDPAVGGSAFSAPASSRIEKSIAAAEEQTGLAFSICVGPAQGDSRKYAESLLTALLGPDPQGALGRVLIFVDPAERQLEILTSALARQRLGDRPCALAALSMTTTFGVGDLVGGLVTGLRMLADATESG